LLTVWTLSIGRVEFSVHTGCNVTIHTSRFLTLTRIGRLQGAEFRVELLSFLGVFAESCSIQYWGASSDRCSKDSKKKEGRKLHLEFYPMNDGCVWARIDGMELLEVVQDTGKRALALKM
jgi:hypothetical protein